MSGYTNEEARMTELGRIAWHSSDEDSGPDVGVSLGLGNGSMLWVGEISRALHSEGGEGVAALGNDAGWWAVLYPDQTVLARFVDSCAAQEFIDRIQSAMSRACGAKPDG
jgi:hypothetical protein